MNFRFNFLKHQIWKNQIENNFTHLCEQDEMGNRKREKEEKNYYQNVR